MSPVTIEMAGFRVADQSDSRVDEPVLYPSTMGRWRSAQT